MSAATKVWNSFDINSYVRVRLTDRGRDIYMEELEKCGDESGPPKEDADGWCELQCWHLMRIFGSHICHGVEPPFDTKIEFQRD